VPQLRIGFFITFLKEEIMKRLMLAIAILGVASSVQAGRDDVWSARTQKIYRSVAGDNEVSVYIKLVKCSGSSLLDGEICGKPAKGPAVCTEVSGGRMKQGDSTTLWVKLPRTKYPIERVYFKD
jgi:hypothetical protein